MYVLTNMIHTYIPNHMYVDTGARQSAPLGFCYCDFTVTRMGLEPKLMVRTYFLRSEGTLPY